MAATPPQNARKTKGNPVMPHRGLSPLLKLQSQSKNIFFRGGQLLPTHARWLGSRNRCAGGDGALAAAVEKKIRKRQKPGEARRAALRGTHKRGHRELTCTLFRRCTSEGAVARTPTSRGVGLVSWRARSGWRPLRRRRSMGVISARYMRLLRCAN